MLTRLLGHWPGVVEASLRFLKKRARRLVLAFAGVALPLAIFAELAEEVREADSFPSGHAMGSATLAAAVVMLLWRTRWRWPALVLGVCFAVWVGASRVYLGVHYPSDILAGWTAALTWTCLAYLVVRPNHRGTGPAALDDGPARD